MAASWRSFLLRKIDIHRTKRGLALWCFHRHLDEERALLTAAGLQSFVVVVLGILIHRSDSVTIVSMIGC